MDPGVTENLDCKINLLNNIKQNQEFLKLLKNILKNYNIFDLATTEARLFKNVLPAISNRFSRIYNDNISLCEAFDDEIIFMLIKENLEVAFELTETLQEILHCIYQHNQVNAADIESVLKYVPHCVLLFTNHWKNSSDTYKSTFNAEISKLIEVTKHLYISFLHMLELSINIRDNNDDLGFLVEALTSICELPKNLYKLDAASAISSWKCFGTVCGKYSTHLENCMNLRIPVSTLCEDIYTMLETILNYDMEAFPRQIKIMNILIKLLFKITDIFYQQLNIFALDLFVFYIKILSLSLENFKSKPFPAEALVALDTDVFKCLDVFLQHLVMGQSDFKSHMEKILDYMEDMVVFKEHPLGVINLLCKILHMVPNVSSDWCLMTVTFVEAIFITLPLCHTELSVNNHSIYQQLIINMSAAILLQDVKFQSFEILLKHILQDKVFVAVLALEIFTLVVSNVHSEECLTLVVNLLYGVNDLLCGFFTSRPEIVYLQKLLQRILKILPDTYKDDLVKLFQPDQYIQIWRFLGFNSLPAHQVRSILSPLMDNTSECIKSIFVRCDENMPINIAEGLDLVATVENLNISDPMFGDVTKFLDIFWASDFESSEILNNNLMYYLMLKITGVTSSCIQNSNLDLQMVSTKLKAFSCKESYWMPVYKIIYGILNSIPSSSIPDINKQRILTQMADIINLPAQNKRNPLQQEMYLQMFKNLNERQKDTLNYLLDHLNPNVTNHIFQYLEKKTISVPLVLDHNHTHNFFFKHKCIQWKTSENTTTSPQLKKAKMELPIKRSDFITNIVTGHDLYKTQKNTSHETRNAQRENSSTFIFNNLEDDSSATEVIQRIRGEVKCLFKVCKSEKLTQKNIADLRLLMSQISSLM